MTLKKRAFLEATALALVTSMTLGLFGCEHEPSNVKVEVDAPDPEASAPVVSLPDPPSATDFVIKEKNDDETLRVQGIIEYKDKHLDKQVVVKGKVIRISAECDPGKAKAENKKCPEPHMLVRDDEAEAEKTLLVIGHTPELLKKAQIEEGQVYDFKGTYSMMGRGFTASEDGLVILEGVGDVNLVDLKK
ncbi:MAG: hypothetical protein VX475_11600 [Myxococcota bacterium]|nr:hypothetical protein [Myxococcota bacterium]